MLKHTTITSSTRTHCFHLSHLSPFLPPFHLSLRGTMNKPNYHLCVCLPPFAPFFSPPPPPSPSPSPSFTLNS